MEGHFADHKDRRISPKHLTRHISAFANADGGELFLGIRERSSNPTTYEWAGFYDVEEANAHLQVFEQLFPLGSDFRYEFLQTETLPGLVLHVEIQKTRNIVKTPGWHGLLAARRTEPSCCECRALGGAFSRKGTDVF